VASVIGLVIVMINEQRNTLGSRIFLKLFFGFIIVILFSMTIVSLMIARQMQQDSLREMDNTLKNQANMLRQSISTTASTTQKDKLQKLVGRLGQKMMRGQQS